MADPKKHDDIDAKQRELDKAAAEKQSTKTQPAAPKNPETAPNDTPEGDVGKAAEPGELNTPNPPKAGMAADGGRAAPSEHGVNGNPNTIPEAGKPFPPDQSPAPSASELDELDRKHGYEPPITALTDNDDEKFSMRKFAELARQLPETTPNGQVFGGFGGVKITYGDIRNIARIGIRSE